MIDWVEGCGKVWGGVKRRIAAGGYFRDEDSFHVDGYATRSHIAKLWEERDGAAHAGVRKQHLHEVFTGEALAFEAAITGAREHWHWLAYTRYVIPSSRMHAKSKRDLLRQQFPRILRSDDAYYDELHAMHCYLSGRMESFLDKLRRNAGEPNPELARQRRG